MSEVEPDTGTTLSPAAEASVSAFAELGLRDSLLRGIAAMEFIEPTDIQRELIPRILKGGDFIGQAKTGTGKTAAFGLPILQRAEKDVSQQALILVPTRELAAQVASELNSLARFTPIRATCIIGGESMREQTRALREGAHIVVGTPGRVIDLYERRQLSFQNVRFAVLDEVDRMLDIGFRDDIRRILSQIKQEHQTVFVSATVGEDIEKLGRQFMRNDAEKVQTSGTVLTVSLVDQKYVPVEPWDKQAMLIHLLRHKDPETTVVFCRTKATVHRLTKALREAKIDAREIHGDLDQRKRTRVMESMRQRKLSVLVASDLAARGLDIEHITHVVNYDLPEDPEVYIHRIGRTARAGRRGNAWSLVTSDQGELLSQIEKLSGVLVEKMDVPEFRPGPLPRDVADQRSREEKLEKRDANELLKNKLLPPRSADTLSEEDRQRMFPGGVVPQQAPTRPVMRKYRTRRSGR